MGDAASVVALEAKAEEWRKDQWMGGAGPAKSGPPSQRWLLRVGKRLVLLEQGDAAVVGHASANQERAIRDGCCRENSAASG